MDGMDRAQEIAALHLAAALDRRQAARPPVQAGQDCLTCGEEIPAERRQALPGCCLCVDCQADAERALGR
jgi:phage/conjugal plasmid C-4 type zinc finger TraR family protein